MSKWESKAIRFSVNFGELEEFGKMEELVGVGNRFRSLRALASKRPAGRWFRLQRERVKLVVLGAQVPKGSRTKPVDAAAIPDTGSTTPVVTGRVVAGSRMVPTGIERPKASGLAPVCPVIRSERSVKFLVLSNAVGPLPPRIDA